jgi:hypothetical protein
LPPSAPAGLEGLNAFFPASDYNFTNAVLGQIVYNRAGVYSISWGVQANLTPPIPAPVPSWSFALFLNGVIIPGTEFTGFNESPNNNPVHTSGQAIVTIPAGGVLELRNVTTLAVTLNPNILGSAVPSTVASINSIALQ